MIVRFLETQSIVSQPVWNIHTVNLQVVRKKDSRNRVDKC